MKKLIFILSIVLFSSCRKYEDWTIVNKWNASTDGFCHYNYYYQGGYIEFADSCQKYNVGDRIRE